MKPKSRGSASEPPKGWMLAGDRSKNYEIFVDRKIFHSGSASGSIRSVTDSAEGLGKLMQEIIPGRCSGRYVRLSAWIKTRDVVKWAALWFQADGEEEDALALDDMRDRPLKGTLDWAKYEIVLKIPSKAVALRFGLILAGPGQGWLDDVALETVGAEIQTTDQRRKHPQNPPRNLDFEE